MPRIVIVGGGPAGLMAADAIASGHPDFASFPVDGKNVTIFESMPSVGRKFLIAGRGGMNITHAEPLADFKQRYGDRASDLSPLLDAFGPDQLRDWIHGLGIETFVGTSGRVFPREMKAAPLLRAWLHRLRQQGVTVQVRHRWLGWDGAGRLRFASPSGEVSIEADVVVLALGGGSWKKLGSDGAWVPVLSECGIAVKPLLPSNCGFDVGWRPHFVERHAGQPIKTVVARFGGREVPGEIMITATGIEGGAVYALSAPLRDSLQHVGKATLFLDLAPGRSQDRLVGELSKARGRDSLANHLRRRAGIDGVKAGLLRELCSPEILASPDSLAHAIKSLPVPLVAPRPIDEAISTAGGVVFDALDDLQMLKGLPGVFCAGEMLDWEAPTGGYLLTACLSTGRAAGLGVLKYLRVKR